MLWSRELASRSESIVILLIVGFSLSPGKDGFFKVVVFLKKSLFSSFSMQALSTCQKPSAPKVTSKHVAHITFDGFSIIFEDAQQCYSASLVSQAFIKVS